MDDLYFNVTDSLYISSANAITAVERLRSDRITHVLKLYDGEPEWPSDFTVCDHAIEDGVFIPKPILDEGVTFLKSSIQSGNSALVVCGLGISRSATFVLAYLLDSGYDLPTAFRTLKSARPQAWPMRALWNTLVTHYNQDYSLDEIERWRTHP